MNQNNRYWEAKKVTLLGAAVNALLGFMKLIGGILFQSHALIADGLHSFSDLITDVMVLFASKFGSQDADESHPYGHQRIETAATLLLSLLLILAGTAIVWHSLDELLYSVQLTPNWLSLPIICFSIIANEALFHYTRYIGTRINSPLVVANAWHHRSDAASSVVVLLGLIASLVGFPLLDTLAAVIVGIMIIKMGMDYGWNSIKELVDSAVSSELLFQIETIINNVAGVRKIHQLRSRFMGNDVLIDVHIIVSPKISVSEGHFIAQHVHQALVDQISSVRDVIVHIDPEDDELSKPSLHLPNREKVQALLENVHLDFPEILFWNVHYLNGKMYLDVTCQPKFTQWSELRTQIKNALQHETGLEEIRLFLFQDA